MSIRIIVNGFMGRMGKEAVKAISQDLEFNLVAQTHHSDNLAQVIQKTSAQVVVDFTNATVAFNNTMTIIEAGAHPVIGTSGLSPEEIEQLQNLCHKKKLGGIIAPNFCIGVLLMMRFAQQAAQYLSEVEIIETHHNDKLDAPSATALKTAQLIAQNRRESPIKKSTHETCKGSRGALYHDIPIHALRLPGVVAKQDIIFGHQGGYLTLSHEVTDRCAFMPGVLLACKKVMQLKKLVYGLESLLT